MTVHRWVVVDDAIMRVVFGPHDWVGPVGDGHLWACLRDGCMWISDVGDICTVDDGISPWVPPVPGLCALEDWALSHGYTYS